MVLAPGACTPHPCVNNDRALRVEVLQTSALGLRGLPPQSPGTRCAWCPTCKGKHLEVFRLLSVSGPCHSSSCMEGSCLTKQSLSCVVFISTELSCDLFFPGPSGTTSGEVWPAPFVQLADVVTRSEHHASPVTTKACPGLLFSSDFFYWGHPPPLGCYPSPVLGAPPSESLESRTCPAQHCPCLSSW